MVGLVQSWPTFGYPDPIDMDRVKTCKLADHLFLPVLEVHVPLMRCVHCNVFAYHETVKQLAKHGVYRVDKDEILAPAEMPYWQKVWSGFRREA